MAEDGGAFRKFSDAGSAASRLVAESRAQLAGGGERRVKGNVAGIVAMLIATAAFVSGDASMKLMSAQMPTGETILVRGIIATTLVWSIAFWSGAAYHLKSYLGRLLGLRTSAEVGGAMFFQNGLARLPFADVGAILQINPLVVTAGAALFLGEKVGWRRWTATAFGLVGALLIIRPGAATFQWASLLLLGAVLCSTVRDLTTRRLEPGIPAIIVTALGITSITIASLGFLPFETWRWPRWGEVAFLAIPAVCSLIGQFCVVLSIRAGDVSAVVPFRYAAIVWTLLYSVAIWREFPDAQTLAGIAVIVSAGLYTFYREQTLRRQAAALARAEAETRP